MTGELTIVESAVADPPVAAAAPKPRKMRKGALSTVMIGLMLIWIGLVYLAYGTGWLEVYLGEQQPVRIGDFWFLPAPWGVILIGAAALLLIEAMLRAFIPAFRRGLLVTLIFAVALLSLAFGEAFPWQVAWPLILIALGGVILIRALFGKRKN